MAAIFILVAGVAFGLYKWIGQRQRTAPTQTLKITRLTSTGKATTAAISPDGKYVVYAQDEDGQESLWMAQVAVSSNVQIVPPAQANYRGITFSRDGNFIYYVRVDKENSLGVLYQAPALGGNPRKLLVNIASPVTFSPDGKQLAFIRAYKNQDESALMIANADGTDEKELVTRKVPNNNFSGTEPAWSPDGKIIAFGQEDVKGGNYRNVVAVRVADGTEQPMTTKRWEGNYAPRLAWLSDNSGVLVTASEQAGNGAQIWFVAWPGGEARQVTNALNSYIDLSMTADSSTLAAVQSEAVVNLWVSQTADLSRSKQITSGVGRNDGTRGIAWAPDGKIVYFSLAGGRQNIWMIDADGRGNKQLSADARRNRDPAVSPDGRYVVWQSNRTGNTNIWRMDIDGGALRQLTQSVEASSPRISPDGKWVVYQDHSNRGRRTMLWKVPIDGGTPMQLTETDSDWQVISPDGKLIAYTYSDEASGQIKIALIPFEGGPPASVFDLPPESRVSGTRISPIQWTPDGHALAFIRTSGGVSNIWTQPLDGSAQKQLTDFKDQRIFNFAWSRDGKQLALSRGVSNADVVLITGFK
jgi:Tol biopolymer transport system component